MAIEGPPQGATRLLRRSVRPLPFNVLMFNVPKASAPIRGYSRLSVAIRAYSRLEPVKASRANTLYLDLFGATWTFAKSAQIPARLYDVLAAQKMHRSR